MVQLLSLIFGTYSNQVGELSNINIFGRLLGDSEMEAITLCQDYLEGDLVKEFLRNNQIHAMPSSRSPGLLGPTWCRATRQEARTC